jgi:aerobic-type carbon monoxide dehydrogenase small subunit (CoxS/CutS family)
VSNDKLTVELAVNGARHTVAVAADETLVTTLRRDLGLLSVRTTCNIGICGVCTVLMDGLPVSACLKLTALSDGSEITTTEKFLVDGKLSDPVAQAFVDHSAFQCSYCTPGMVLTAQSLLLEVSTPTTEEIREFMAGNLCRCGSHPQVIEAIQSVTGKIESGQ